MSVEITGYGSKHSHEFKLTLTETSYDVSSNTSVLSYSFTVYKSSYSWSGLNNVSYLYSINGTDFTGTIPTYTAGSILTIGSGQMTINHNADGSKVVGAYFNVYDGSGASYCCGNASGSGNITLTTIPRYMTVIESLKTKNYNSITMQWSSTEPSTDIEYSLNDGTYIDVGGTVASDHKFGEYVISGLSANTTYKIETRCKSSVTDLWSYSGALNIKTDEAQITISTTDIDFGDNAVVTLTNPSSLSTNLVGTIDSTEIVNQSITTGTNTITFTDTQLTNIFKKYGDISQSNTVTMVLTATASNGSTSTANLVITFTGDRATIWVYASNTWKKGIVWVKDNGTWKKGIAWKGVNGTWKKAL